MMPSDRIKKSSGTFLLAVVVACAAAQPADQHKEISFEVLSVRVLSSAEAAKRSPDYIGPNVAVRLRLSSKKGVHYYALSSSFIPLGYEVTITNGETRWFWYQKMRTESPGFNELANLVPGHWLILHPGTAIEWEKLASTHDYGETHAFTIFIKDKEHSTPREIISAQFLVPKEKPPPG